MGPSIERLKSARDDIANALAAIEKRTGLGDDAGISPAGRPLIEELLQLGESAWGPLLTSLKDDEELHGLLTRLKREISKIREQRDLVFSPIRQIGRRAFFDFNSGGLFVEMRFVKSEGESLEVRHDLEDTLRIAVAVIEAVAEVMRNMDVLSVDAKRRCIGEEFEKNLKEATKGLEQIEGALNSITM